MFNLKSIDPDMRTTARRTTEGFLSPTSVVSYTPQTGLSESCPKMITYCYDLNVCVFPKIQMVEI